MNNLINFVNEKLKINKNDKSTNNNDKKNQYSSNWQWFNNLICDVKLEQDQLEAMFWNLTDDEIKVWIKEIQDCYVGTEDEDAAKEITDVESLAYFYYNYPITT